MFFKKVHFPPHTHTLQKLGCWECSLLHGYPDGDGAAPLDNSGKLLALKLLDCSSKHNCKLSKSCNRYWGFLPKLFLENELYLALHYINSTKSSSETHRNGHCKRCHTSIQELSSSHGFELLLVHGALPEPGGGLGCHLLSENSPVNLLSPVPCLEPCQNDQISSN